MHRSSRIGMTLAFALFAACNSSDRAASDGSPGGDAAGPPPPASAAEVCARYVECVAKTNPGALKLIADQYGASGSCFGSLGDKLCREACITGLTQNHTAFPGEAACPACLSDSDCSEALQPACDVAAGSCARCTRDAHCGGATPACDSARHTCVACTSDSHCNGGGCDVANQICQGCVTDAHCSAPTPACLSSAGRCVACTKKEHCGGSECDTVNNQCCQTPSCGAIRSLIGTKRWICGTHLTDCGDKDCGTCQGGGAGGGSCVDGECISGGASCTPGASGGCPVGEICAYAPSTKSYRCSYDHNGEKCTYPDFNGDQCADSRLSGASERIGFRCNESAICAQYCKNSSECVGGRSCTLISGLNYGECL